MSKKQPLLIGFVAYSGTGKTTLLCKLIPLLKDKGLRIGVIKHAHHDFDIDHPKKDSYALRKSGADTLLIASHKRTAIIIEHPEVSAEPSFEDALVNIPSADLDLLLVEGFKHADYPKIELHREALNKPYLYPTDPHIIGIACDHDLAPSRLIQQFDLNQPQQIADFIAFNIVGMGDEIAI
ncbi:MAG TPA: molybdopterin-guanine dinucleotide biosynthesis protein B [Leucothrix mucor]|uniref:Molybdopterin-guanine dinucleotide biosynthesis protein B n=1 Tax=Leucothrix mucor TaxID=45248 RepID=A0A7V2SYQ1_LEUMU|nr:molybdopterin-guanine dinucleotide biosynthesis protein B [Leucothrix mucor]